LKQIGFPQDIVVSILHTWSKKNRPINGKHTITEQEIIEQVKSAYCHFYHSYGYEDPAIRPYCSNQCPIYLKYQDISKQKV